MGEIQQGAEKPCWDRMKKWRRRHASEAHRMVKKAFQRGRSERRGNAYFAPYGEPLSDARTTLEDFFSILL